MTKEEMLDRISSRELAQWKALFILEKEDEDNEKIKSEMIQSFGR